MAATKCTRCDAEWSGLNTGHCMACHTTFTGITAFDAHRRNGSCVPPESVGLTLTKRAYPCYGYPSDDSGAWWATEERPVGEPQIDAGPITFGDDGFEVSL